MFEDIKKIFKHSIIKILPFKKNQIIIVTGNKFKFLLLNFDKKCFSGSNNNTSIEEIFNYNSSLLFMSLDINPDGKDAYLMIADPIKSINLFKFI